MDLKEILSISGKPGLYKMISQTKSGIVVESLEDKKRFLAFSSEKISALDDISIYTLNGDIPLRKVMLKIAEKENNKECISLKKNNNELKDYFKQLVDNYDEEKVYVSDIKKVYRWYNLLQQINLLDVLKEKEETASEVKKTTKKENSTQEEKKEPEDTPQKKPPVKKKSTIPKVKKENSK